MKTLSIHCIAIIFLAASVIASASPVLYIPERIPGVFGIPVGVPIFYTSDGADISVLVFSIDFDEACLDFTNSDTDGDGVPDDIVFVLPAQFTGSVSYDDADIDGELDFVIADFGPPLASLPDGVIAYMIFTPTCQPEEVGILARVGFSSAPAASFGDTGGQSVSGTTFDGSVQIEDPIFSDGFESGDTTAWSVAVGGD